MANLDFGQGEDGPDSSDDDVAWYTSTTRILHSFTVLVFSRILHVFALFKFSSGHTLSRGIRVHVEGRRETGSKIRYKPMS